MSKTVIKECSTCAVWEPLNTSQLCEKGFCYKISYLPSPKKRTDYCGSWQEYENGVMG